MRAASSEQINQTAEHTQTNPTNRPLPFEQILYAEPQHLQSPRLATTLAAIRCGLPPNAPSGYNGVPDSHIEQIAIGALLELGRALQLRRPFSPTPTEAQSSDTFIEEQVGLRRYYISITSEFTSQPTPATRSNTGSSTPQTNDMNTILSTINELYVNNIEQLTRMPADPSQAPESMRTTRLHATSQQILALIELYDVTDFRQNIELVRVAFPYGMMFSGRRQGAEIDSTDQRGIDASAHNSLNAQPNIEGPVAYRVLHLLHSDSSEDSSSTTSCEPDPRSEFHRGFELTNLMSFIAKYPDALDQLKYADEKGFGRGVTREIYTEAFKQIEQGQLFEKDPDSSMLTVMDLVNSTKDGPARLNQIASLDNVGQVIASLYLRIQVGQNIAPSAHFAKDLFRAFQILQDLRLSFDRSGRLQASADQMVMLSEFIWQRNLSETLPTTPEPMPEAATAMAMPNRETDNGEGVTTTTAPAITHAISRHAESICAAYSLDEKLAPMVALANGFHLIIQHYPTKVDVTAETLEQSFNSISLREALLTRPENPPFEIECQLNRKRGESGSEKSLLETRASDYIRHFLLHDEGVTDANVKELNQFITGEQYILGTAMIKINIYKNKDNARPLPQAQTCTRGLGLWENQLESYEQFKHDLQAAILNNGHEFNRA